MVKEIRIFCEGGGDSSSTKDILRKGMNQFLAEMVEQIPKHDLEPALKNASRNTKKGQYHKIYHAAKLLEMLDTANVRQAAPHCERLFGILENLLI